MGRIGSVFVKGGKLIYGSERLIWCAVVDWRFSSLVGKEEIRLSPLVIDLIEKPARKEGLMTVPER